jgi:hypothetical protein
VPKYELIFCPDHTGGVRLAPNFVNHLAMLFNYGVHQKVTFPDLNSVDPLCKTTRVYAHAPLQGVVDVLKNLGLLLPGVSQLAGSSAGSLIAGMLNFL